MKYIEYNKKISERLKSQYERTVDCDSKFVNKDEFMEKIGTNKVEANEEQEINSNIKVTRKTRSKDTKHISIEQENVHSLKQSEVNKKSTKSQLNTIPEDGKHSKFIKIADTPTSNEYMTKDNIYVKLHNQEIYEEIKNPSDKNEKLFVKLHNGNLFEKIVNKDNKMKHDDSDSDADVDTNKEEKTQNKSVKSESSEEADRYHYNIDLSENTVCF